MKKVFNEMKVASIRDLKEVVQKEIPELTPDDYEQELPEDAESLEVIDEKLKALEDESI